MQQSRHTVRAEDCVYRGSVSRVSLEQVFDEVMQLIGEVTG